MSAASDRTEMVCKSALISEYGFTAKLIKQLGPPDKQSVNPHHRSGPRISFFELTRVNKFIQDNAEAINSVLHNRAGRRAASIKGVQTKKQRLLTNLRKTPLQVRRLPKSLDDLRDIAREHAMTRGGCEPGLNGLLATIRHEFTNYDEILALIEGKVGTNEAYIEIRAYLDERVVQLFCEWYGRDCYESLHTASHPPQR